MLASGLRNTPISATIESGLPEQPHIALPYANFASFLQAVCPLLNEMDVD